MQGPDRVQDIVCQDACALAKEGFGLMEQGQETRRSGFMLLARDNAVRAVRCLALGQEAVEAASLGLQC